MANLTPVGVQAVVAGLDKFKSDMSSMSGSVDSFQTKTKTAGEKAADAMRSFGLGLGIATAGAFALKKVWDQTGAAFIKSAGEVEALSRLIGASAEESSRLIGLSQIMGVSQDTLATALKGAIRKGFEPTIEGLARMSDQYLAIQDPIARTKFLMDTFGRSGADIGELMEKGSKGITAYGNSVKTVFTQSDIDNAKKVSEGIGMVTDQWQALKMRVAKPIIMALVFDINQQQQFADLTVQAGNAQYALGLHIDENASRLQKATVYVDDNNKVVAIGKDALIAYAQSVGITEDALQGATTWGNNATDAIERLRAGLSVPLPTPNLPKITGGWGDWPITPGGKALNPRGWMPAAADMTAQATVKLDATKALADLAAMKVAAADIKDKTATFTIIHKDIYQYVDQGLRERASGGPVTRGTPYLVGERGPERFVPSQSGYILPAIYSGAYAGASMREDNRQINTGDINIRGKPSWDSFDQAMRQWLNV